MSQVLRKIINTSKAPKAIGPYNQAILADKTLYISGQLGMDSKTMMLVDETIEGQTTQALVNMKHILEAANCTFSNVVKTTVLLSDINDFVSMNHVYSSFFQEPYPARVAYQVANLPKLAKVEIDAVAIVGEIINQ